MTKILKDLGDEGLVSASRGAAGGIRLAMPPEEFTVKDIIESLEGGDFFPGVFLVFRAASSVLDGTDSFESKYAIHDVAWRAARLSLSRAKSVGRSRRPWFTRACLELLGHPPGMYAWTRSIHEIPGDTKPGS